MSARKILLPVDFSRSGEGALHLATSLARERGATLIIAHVEELPAAYAAGEFYYGIPEPPTEELRRMLEQVRPSDPKVPCEHRLITGHPADAIVELADQEHVDLIVMATHGRTGLSRLLMGSVAESVVRRANCPVLTYKHRAERGDQVS